MITNKGITLYHYDGKEWTRLYYPAANVLYRKAGEINKGLTAVGNAVIRIPTDDDIPVIPGDRAVIGECAAEKPPKSNDTLTLTEVTDNRRGSANMHHWKVVGA